MGYRYRVHSAKLPGKPDIVFAGRKKVIFVHGCFWHRHEGCKRATTPATRQDYWLPKFSRTVERDRALVHEIGEMGWSSLTIWECELRDTTSLAKRLKAFVD